MREASKSARRRFNENPTFWNSVFSGIGLDVGPGDDPCNHLIKWPIVKLEKFDYDRGDANYIRQHFDDNYFDFIHSSHSLEHMVRHPFVCLQDWCALLKVGGHLVVTIPDFEMYEHGMWPSRFNGDHKWAFTTINSYDNNLPYMVCAEYIPIILEKSGMELIHIKRLTDGWNPKDTGDQTLSFERGVECAWEILAVKKTETNVKTPIAVCRNDALGDSIAVSAFLNHMAKKHEVTFKTSDNNMPFHSGDYALVRQMDNIDVDLNDYDEQNPYLPLWELGFHKTRIPIPSDAIPKINLTTEELQRVELNKQTPYIIIDLSPIFLASRMVEFDSNAIIKWATENDIQVRILNTMAPRDLLVEIAGCLAIVGRDSGPMQIAQALGASMVPLMSAVNPIYRYKESSTTKPLTSKCPIVTPFCYHKNWYHTDCPVASNGVAPCGKYRSEDIINALIDVIGK